MLYLVAEDLSESKGKVKTFAVPRFLSANMLDEAYEREATPPEELFQGGMAVYNGYEPEEIVIEFDSDVAYFVRERRWHPSQRVTHLEAGRVRVQFELGQTPELIAWILGFGPSAKVRKPDGLATKIKETARNVVEMYG
jgi:predicted DNA-binding transcriptional regulator YafY